MLHTHATAYKLHARKHTFVAGSESSANFMVPSSDYLDHLTDQALLNVTVLALVEGTNQSWVGKKTAPLHKPSIPITVTKAKTKKGMYRILCRILAMG